MSPFFVLYLSFLTLIPLHFSQLRDPSPRLTYLKYRYLSFLLHVGDI